MKCNGCGNQNALRVRIMYEKGTRYEVCDKCGELGSTNFNEEVSQVHEPYFDEHLADKKNPHGRWIHSRAEKKVVLQSLGLREKSESRIPFIKDVKKRRDYFKTQFGG